MKMTGAELIIRILEMHGIDTVTGIPGGSILPLYDALSKSSIRHILARHEQGAGFISQGMARSTGKTAVCLATSGPGATNLVTALADAKQDSVPLVAITGQVPTQFLGTDAFQEVDIYQMTVSVTKHNFSARSAEDILTMLPAAFSIARSGRPGPVLVDIPKDVFQQTLDCTVPEPLPDRELPHADPALLAQAAAMIRKSKRPVILAGGGIISGCAAGELAALARRNSIPVAHTLMGTGSFPRSDRLCLGMVGMHGASAANLLFEKTDLLIALGVRFGDRTVGRLDSFCPEAKFLHIDIDDSELGKIRNASVSLRSDLKSALSTLTDLVENRSRNEWLNEVREIQSANAPKMLQPLPHPAAVLSLVKERITDEAVTTDVGQHQMWSAQIIGGETPRSFLTSGGLGTMGFGLPAAIGAAYANPGRRAVCITGDGSIQMNIQELGTLADLGLPVSVILLNNGHLGLVRQQQELFFENRIYASKFQRQTDFAAIAEGFGIRAMRAEKPEEIEGVLNEAFTCTGPFFAEILVDETANVYPMVPPGRANSEMIGG